MNNSLWKENKFDKVKAIKFHSFPCGEICIKLEGDKFILMSKYVYM